MRLWIVGMAYAAMLMSSAVVSAQNYSLNGEASAFNGNCFAVTQNQLWQNGSVWYTDLLDLTQPFTLEFQMNFGANDDGGADGMVFVLQTVGPNAIGNDGAGIGYEGFNPAFGIEFDTYQNTLYSDLTTDHVAFQLNGDINHAGANNIAGPVNANVTGSNIENGQDHPVKITWNPTTEVVEFYFDCAFRLSAQIDLVNSVFNGTSEVWWGFTGATGGLSNLQLVCLAEVYEFTDNLEYTICPGESVTLNANGNPEGAYLWSPSTNLSNSISQTTVASPSSSTEYCYTYTDVCGNLYNGCIQVNVEEPPSVNAGEDDVYCEGDQYLLIGTSNQADASFQWSSTTGNFTTATTEISTFIDAPGTYTLTATSAIAQCVGSDEVEISETPLPQPEIDSPVSKCTYDSTVLDAGSEWQSVTWFDGSQSATYTAELPGNFDAVIVENDCEVTVTFVVEDILLQDIELGPTQIICNGQSALLEAGTSVSWNTGANGESITPQTGGEYIAEFELQGCFERDTIDVVVLEPPYLELGPDTLFCQGQIVELWAQEVGLWNTGEVDDGIQVSLPGLYRIDVVQGPCLVVDSIHVEQLPLPFVTLGDDPIYCEGNRYELTALGEFADYYTWSTGDSTEMISVEESMDLAIEVGNACGVSSDSLHVIFEDCSVTIFMPTMFTPNGDGINDEYWPSVNNVESYQLTVYNRWGSEVFVSTDPAEPWLGDSMFDGFFAPNGVYDFLLVCRTSKGNAVERRGHIVLVR